MSRDKLLALFWPESDSDRARHSLADSLYQIRKELGEGAILSVGEDLWLNAEVVSSDVEEFATALERGDLNSAIIAYAGPLLDGFHLGNAPDFERWIDGERERLARARAQALERLAEEATADGDVRGAVELWRRLAGADPHNSRVALRLMQALESAGDRAGAIQHARIHATLLEQDFAAEPDRAISELAERMRSEAVDAGSSAGEARVPKPEVIEAENPKPVISGAPEAQPTRVRRWKTIALPVGRVLGTAVVVSLVWLLVARSPRQGAAAEASAVGAKSIAVLPFTNLSSDPEEDYFSDGLTEELIAVLAQVRSLRVAARMSSFAFKGENRDIREIGRALDVGAVLDGSVRKEGDRVRVNARLTSAADGFHLWSETYEHEVTDIFAIQRDLALRIVGALQAELTLAERVRLAQRPTDNAEAYALYLKGRYFWNQRTPSAFARAIEYFERAIDADPRYAAAYAGLAMSYSLQGLSGSVAPGDARERMRKAGFTAVELDDARAEAHAALGAYLHVYDWDSDAAERAHLRAITLDPSYPTARHLYGNLLVAMGRIDEALTQKTKAVELDPLDPALSESLGEALLRVGRPDDALEHYRNALELDSTSWRTHAGLASYYERTGRPDEAVRGYERAVELGGSIPLPRIGLARVLVLTGRRADARRLLAELQAEAERSGRYQPLIATVLVALDDVDGALAWLERSYRQRHPGLRFIGREPGFTPLDGDPRYVDLLRRVGLTR